MTSNSPSVEQSPSQNNAPTLGEIAQIAAHILSSQAQTIKALIADSDVADTAFSGFVLDSRELPSPESQSVQHTQRQTKPAFVLLKSHTQPIEKSQQYVKSAAQKAAFILSEIDESTLSSGLQNADDLTGNGCPIVYVPALRDVLGTLIQLSLLPASELKNIKSASDILGALPHVVAVTGTNGKTTISQLIAQLCHLSGIEGIRDSAVMGTAGNGRLDSLIQASHTTGDALAVQSFLRQMKNESVELLSLEASSHGLDQQRLQGVPVQVAVYTNLSRDHLDYHPDMQDYARAKARLFDTQYFPHLTHAIINGDDEFAPLMIETATKSGLQVWVYSLNAGFNTDALKQKAEQIDTIDATFIAKDISPSLEGATIDIEIAGGQVSGTDTSPSMLTVNSPLLGRFNVANLLAAIAAGLALGIDQQLMPKLVSQLQGASGRMQRVEPKADDGQASSEYGVFIVDYAHTPDALTQVLTSLKPHCSGNLWAVFGCGGDRDSGKRPLMAQAGLSVADKVVLTSDNPRTEDPELILKDMVVGMTPAQHDKTDIITERRAAIYHAVEHAAPDDIVVIAGKGHETYQEVNGVRHDFDDREVLQQAFEQRSF